MKRIGWDDRLDLNETIARIILNPKTKQIVSTTLYQKHLRFKCKRCATFCCKLGGPKLTDKDVKMIKKVGYCAEKFLEPVFDNKFKGLPIIRGSLKSKEDGSCIFLKFIASGVYECSIYSFRPALCRLYPFDFEKVGPNTLMVKLIPCCRGLNNHDGEFVNERFVVNYLLDAILDLIV